MSALAKMSRGGRGDRRPRPAIDLVGRADAAAGAGLDQHLVAGRDIFADRARRQPDAIFLDLDFLGHTDAHLGLLFEFTPRS